MSLGHLRDVSGTFTGCISNDSHCFVSCSASYLLGLTSVLPGHLLCCFRAKSLESKPCAIVCFLGQVVRSLYSHCLAL